MDELTVQVPRLAQAMREMAVCATWFIRLDDEIEATLGTADYVFTEHAPLLDTLRADGHQIAWHLHSYDRRGGRWAQNLDSGSIVEEMHRHAPAARAFGLRAFRMGWGYHTNDTMATLAELGVPVDSSAIPRPRYPWEESEKDWETTGAAPYFPSRRDYRVPGPDRVPVMEVPISVTTVPAPYDSGPVLRYLNPAYHTGIFRSALETWLEGHSHLVTITHPYETAGGREHGLLAFRLEAWVRNVTTIREAAARSGRTAGFVTISEFAEEARKAFRASPDS
jgi:hypothetical protein